MSLNFQSQNTFINTLLPVGSPANIRFNGSQEAVSDIEYLVSKQCFGFDPGAGANYLDVILLAFNFSREKHHFLPVDTHKLLSNYETALFSDVARRNGLNLIHNRPGTMNQSVPPLRHIPYLLDSFYLPPPNQPRYRLGVATRCWKNESDTSDLVADVTVDYYTGDDIDEDEYHTIWIINNNEHNLHGGVDTWLALMSSNGDDIQTLLQNKYDHVGSLCGNNIFTGPPNQRSTTQVPGHTHSGVLSPHAISRIDPSYGNNPRWPESSTDLERGYNDHPTAPERIPGAPPFETSLPIHELSDCTMEELMSYYPEHVLHWPGLAILYNHYRFRLSNPIFGDITHYIRNARGDHVDIPKGAFRRATKRAGSQILHDYKTGNSDGHMQPLSEAVQASGQSLESFLKSSLWTPPSDIVLQPTIPLSEVGSSVFNHPLGNFAARVLAAMQNQMSPPPPNKYATQSHPLIKRCLHGSPEVDEAMRETISLNYYPVHLPEEFVIQHYHTHLTHEPLLYVLIKYSGGQIARMVPEEACPDQTHLGFKTYAAKLRKRQQMALLQRGDRRKILCKGMSKKKYDEVWESLKKEYQEERIRGGYGGIRVRDGNSGKRKVSEEEERDETRRSEPNRKRRRTRKGRHGEKQSTDVPNTYAIPAQPIYTGAHHPTPSFDSSMATSMMQRSQVPWTTGISQQELRFDASANFQNDLTSNPFTAGPSNTGLESVHEQFPCQNYDLQFGYSEHQPICDRSSQNTFDYNIDNVPHYPSTIDPFEQGQYNTPQIPIKLEEVDTSFNTMPTHYNADPYFLQPGINDSMANTEAPSDEMNRELSPEDWDQMINFEHNSPNHTISVQNYGGTLDATSPVNTASSAPDIQEHYAIPNTKDFTSYNPESQYHTTAPVHDSGNEYNSSPPIISPQADPQIFTSSRPVIPSAATQTPWANLSTPTISPALHENVEINAENYSRALTAFPPSIPPNFEFLYPAPMGERMGSLISLDQLMDMDALTSPDFLEKGGIESIEEFYVGGLGLGDGMGGEGVDVEGEGCGRVEDDGGGIEGWLEGVRGLSPGSTLVEDTVGNAQVEELEREREERRRSVGSNDSMASLFGE